jgi:hypothetical protein
MEAGGDTLTFFAKQKCKLKNDRDVIFEQRKG